MLYLGAKVHQTSGKLTIMIQYTLRNMEKRILNYRVIIEPEKIGKKTAYNAYCPSLGVADYGDTVEKALESIKEGIQLAVECLIEDKQDIPMDNIDEQLITSIKISTTSPLTHSR